MSDKEYTGYFTFKVPDGFAQIQLQNISHFLVEDGKTILVFKNNDKRIITESMKNIETKLQGHEFIRVHQNCIINLRQELNFCTKARSISLPNNEQVKIAKDRLACVKKLLLLYGREEKPQNNKKS